MQLENKQKQIILLYYNNKNNLDDFEYNKICINNNNASDICVGTHNSSKQKPSTS